MSARYRAGKLRLTPKQVQRLASGAMSGSPVGLVLGGGDMEIEVALTPKQCALVEGGAKRIKFSAAQLRKMAGAGVFGDLGDAAKPLVESGISAGLSAIPGVGPAVAAVGAPLISGVIGPLIDTIGKEIDYAVSKKPKFKQLAANRSKNVARAQSYAAASPEKQAAQFQQFSKTMAKAPKFVRAPKTQVEYDAIQARNLGLETNEKTIRSKHKADFMAAEGGRRMTPAQKKQISGGRMTVGREASDYIAAQLSRALKN